MDPQAWQCPRREALRYPWCAGPLAGRKTAPEKGFFLLTYCCGLSHSLLSCWHGAEILEVLPEGKIMWGPCSKCLSASVARPPLVSVSASNELPSKWLCHTGMCLFCQSPMASDIWGAMHDAGWHCSLGNMAREERSWHWPRACLVISQVRLSILPSLCLGPRGVSPQPAPG